ncbi:hypothetical protein BDN70DRAFT_935519 [Pholiota conissans]|uniref:Berberine/berberine-like domain-containing protein n=1 Tax=Pholiota conissans TaxID=109636 RepID=A0A9P6CR78_9AGAR|nr:hypothetical protein BDN70DRAFT_935519 [Pholiota conissans]
MHELSDHEPLTDDSPSEMRRSIRYQRLRTCHKPQIQLYHRHPDLHVQVQPGQNETRPQAAIVGTFRHYYESHKLKSDIDVFCSYDGILPTGTDDPFAEFKAIKQAVKPAANSITEKGGTRLLLDAWPFLPNIFDNSTPAAWPHKKGEAVSPLLAFYTWENEKDDDFWVGEMKRALGEIQTVAKSEGCTRDDAPIYLNTTLGDTPVKDIYGENHSKLVRIKAKYDRHNTMRNAEGFVIPIA